MSTQLANPTILVNNEPVGIMPNSLVYDEGLGEQNMRAASFGGDEVEPVYSDNIETKFGSVTFALPATIQNINLARAWKVNRNNNVVQVVGTTPDGGTLTKTFTSAAILNNYPVALGSDTDIPIEFKSRAAV